MIKPAALTDHVLPVRRVFTGSRVGQECTIVVQSVVRYGLERPHVDFFPEFAEIKDDWGAEVQSEHLGFEGEIELVRIDMGRDVGRKGLDKGNGTQRRE